MKILTRSLSALMLGLSLCGAPILPAHAAPVKGAKPAANPQVEEGKRFVASLKLTDAQKAKMGAIMQAQGAQMRAIRDNPKLSDADKMTKMRAIAQAGEAKINAVMTPDQRKKAAAYKARMMARFKAAQKNARKPR